MPAIAADRRTPVGRARTEHPGRHPAGAGGSVAIEILSKSIPDGYTLGATADFLIIFPVAYRKLDFDPVKDLAPIALAVRTAQRSAALPEVPTLIESGVSGFDMAQWVAVLGPSGLSQPIVARLHAEIGRLLAMPAVRERLAASGFEPSPSPARARRPSCRGAFARASSAGASSPPSSGWN